MACGEHEHCDECGCVPPLMADIAKRQAEYILGMAPDRIEAGEAATEWDDDEFGPEPEMTILFRGEACNIVGDAVMKHWERMGISPDVMDFDSATNASVLSILLEWANSELSRKGA